MRTFVLLTKQQSGEATLYTQIKSPRNGLRFYLNTGIKVDISLWHECCGDLHLYSTSPKNGEKDKKRVERQVMDAYLAIEEVKKRGIYTKEDIQEAVKAVVFKEQNKDYALAQQLQREEAERQEELARIEKAREDADVRKYLASLIEGMRRGTIRIEGKGRNKGERYTPNTIKMWVNLQGIIERFYQTHPFTWETIDRRFATRFRSWMEDEGYMAKTINKYVGQFVALINRAQGEGLHTNTAAAGCFLKPAVDEAQKATEIYLTAEELNALYQMPLTGEKELVRDIFIVGCCTCQRVSDYSRLRKENFVTTARGAKVVKIQQQKTRNFVTIPILDNKLTDIMERYDYQLPQLPANFDQILNRYIKMICKELSETVPSLAEELPTLLTMKERAKEERGEVTFKRDEYGRVLKPRYELVTSHTARRTGITLLYLTGRFDIFQMMHVSGHKEAKTFRDYIKLSGDEMAEQIAEKMGNNNLF